MTVSLRKTMLVLSTTLLTVQAVFMPIGTVYAGTTLDPENQEQVELPPMTNYLEEQDNDPRFFFTSSRMQGTVEDTIKVTFFSDQEVQGARVFLPEEATLLKDQLAAGISIEQGEQPREWIVQSKRVQKTFVLPLVFEKAGNYELSVEEVTAHLDISEQEETGEEVQVEETESSVEDSVGQEESKEENQENEQSVEEEREPAAEAPQEQQTDEEETDEASKLVEPTVFDGETAVVATMAEFREAVANPDIGIISVQANLTESTANVLTVDRSLLIQGNGYTMTFGNNGFYFQLEEVEEEVSFRIENAILTKTGANPLINASIESSRNWMVELEDIIEVNANTMRLASLPEGRILFTGGVSNFTRTSSTQTFIEAKELVATNQAEVTISRGNATVFFSSAGVSNPKLTVENGATIKITTASGTANTIDLRGESPEIVLRSNGQLGISTVGTTAAPTDMTNNAIALTGTTPKIAMNSESSLIISSTLAKRGIHMSGTDAQLVLNDSDISVTTATQSAVNLVGDNPLFSINNSNSSLTSTTGGSLTIAGSTPIITFEESVANITSTTGHRLNLIGDTPLLSISNTEIKFNALTGRGIYLQGAMPQVLLDNSKIEMTDTGASQGMILQGEDALLSLSNQSEFNLSGAGTGTTENIQIGNNNARPELSVIGGSKLSVTTTSGNATATSTANNAIHLNGGTPIINVKNNSEIDIQITSGLRRGILLTGSESRVNFDKSDFIINSINSVALRMDGKNPELLIDKQSKFDIKESGTNANNTIELNGNEPEVKIDSQSQVKTNTSSSLSNHTTNTFDIRGTTPKFIVNNSELDLSVPIGFKRGILLSGNNAELLISKTNFIGNVLRANTLSMETVGGTITITDSSNVVFNSSTDRTGGVVDFINESRDNSFVVKESSTFETLNTVRERLGSRVQVLNMNGSNNTIQVLSGSNLTLDNSVASSGSSVSSNYAIVTMGGNGNFLIGSSDNDSRTTLNFLSNYGFSMIATSGKLNFNQEPNTIFTTTGNTTNAIFTANDLEFVIDRPYYYDFRNDNNNGNLFSGTQNSTLTITESFFSAWIKGNDLSSNPDHSMNRIGNIGYQGTNFNSISSIMDSEFGEQLSSLVDISRISANNSAPIFMGYRQPTSADKSFFAQFGVDEGNDGVRPAHEDEVFARVRVTDTNDSSKEYQVSTNNTNITWEEYNDGIEYSSEGRIKVELQELISPNSIIEFVEIWRGSNEYKIAMSEEEVSRLPKVESINVTPPNLIDVGMDFRLYEGQSNIYIGPNENNKPGTEAVLFINGEKIDQKTIENDGSIKFDIDSELVSNDEVQIALQDNDGPIIDTMSTINNKFSRPKTNNDFGNKTPIESDYRYHDATFKKAVAYLVVERKSVNPVDPLDPEVEVDPENKPDLPQEQGPLSIDFISSFNFGSQGISVRDQWYYAQPQRLLNSDGTINQGEERPNYIQISDRRAENDRHGWQLSVTQNGQFTNLDDHQLTGARLHLTNQQFATAQGGVEPVLCHQEGVVLVPEHKTELITANDEQGTGTWIYRFGDGTSAGESVALEVPKSALPRATTYQTTLTWELSAVPENE